MRYVQFVVYVFDLLRFALARIGQHRALVMWTLIGLITATILSMSLLLYVDGVNSGLLSSRLPDPPFAFRYRYLGAWNGAISQSMTETAGEHIRESFTGAIGLPTQQFVDYIGSGAWSVNGDGYALGTFTLGTLHGAEEQIEITAGEWDQNSPAVAIDNSDEIPVLLHESVFTQMGIQVGDRLTVNRFGLGTITLRVAALWKAINPADPSWIFPPRFFETVLLINREDFWGIVSPLESPVEEAAWSIIFDGAGVQTADIPPLLVQIQDGERAASDVLAGIRLERSPIEGMRAFNQEVEQLAIQLAIMSLPVGGLTLYFVALVAGLLVSRQTGDDSVLVSRGMSRRALLFIHALIWIVLANAAFGVALLCSPEVVQIIGRTSSFLRFDNVDTPLAITYMPRTLAVGIATALIAAGVGMLTSWRANRHGIIQRASLAGRAWWQRVYLDVLLFIPSIYALFSLWQSGGLTASASNPFNDPLTLGAPTLFALSTTLLFLRVYPLFLRVWLGVISLGRSVSLLMSLRELIRGIGRYRGLLLMTGFTLSLTGFMASMASTLDRSLEDVINYQIGADAVIIPVTDAETENQTNSSGQQTGVTVTGFNVLPAEDLVAIDGVDAVSRVGKYPAQIILPSQRPAGTVVGIDRATIAAVARSRADYSDLPYADLFNLLATQRTGVIISARFAREHRITIGQVLTVQINALNTWSEIQAPVIGIIDYFPTLDPADGFFALMSIDVVFETVGSALPHELWIEIDADANMNTIEQQITELGYPILEWRDPATALRSALTAPLRRGVLGFLSVGFIASIVLTLIGAIVQNAATFRVQASQLGILRAMGLSGMGAAIYLLMVQLLATLGGIIGGTLIGVATSLLYLPVLDFSGGLPPYLIRVAWEDITLVYALFGGALLSIILLTTAIMSRQSLTTLVKLGDT